MTNEREPQYIQAINLIEASTSPFTTLNGEVFVSHNNGSYIENHPVRSNSFKQLIGSTFFNSSGRVLGKDCHEKIRDHYGALAYQSGVKEEVYTRTKFKEGAIYYDLANDNGEVIKIAQEGWEVITSPPIKFVRSRSMLPLVTPERQGADLSILRRHLNIGSDDDWFLILGFILGSLYKKPYVILIHNGEQGTGKSTKSKMIASIIDPSSAPLTSKPNTERDVFIAAEKSHLLCYDNLSGLKPWASDTFCILATGGGYRTRRLYTDDEEKIFNVAKPVQMNGIDDIATRGDLIDRSIVISSPLINSRQRVSETELWENFHRDLPKIMGGIFNALSIALRNLPSITLEEKPRMAEYALFGCAAAETMGITQERFMQAYNRNLAMANRNSLELNPVASALIELINNAPNSEWTGTMTELRDCLLHIIPDELQRSRFIPQTPLALSNTLRKLSPMLRHEGIYYEQLPRTNSGRGYRIHKTIPRDDRDNELTI